MNINVYLPDELGERAKKAQVNFSALLRDGVSAELERREARAATLGESTVHEVLVEDENQYPYTARLHGAELVSNEQAEATAYLLDDGRLVVAAVPHDGEIRLHYYDRTDLDVWQHFSSESQWLGQWFSTGQVVEIMSKLGKRAVVDIGKRG
jgi:hypothetical protein